MRMSVSCDHHSGHGCWIDAMDDDRGRSQTTVSGDGTRSCPGTPHRFPSHGQQHQHHHQHHGRDFPHAPQSQPSSSGNPLHHGDEDEALAPLSGDFPSPPAPADGPIHLLPRNSFDDDDASVSSSSSSVVWTMMMMRRRKKRNDWRHPRDHGHFPSCSVLASVRQDLCS